MNRIVNNISRSAIVCSMAFAMVASLNSCSSSGAKDKEDEHKTEAEAPAQEIVPVAKGRLSSSLQLPGELIAYQQVDLYAKVSSFVKSLNADVGSAVSQGQLLATMEAPELNSQLAAAESRLKAQEAVYYASKALYDRLFETSKTPGTVSQNDLDQALAKKNADYAQLEAAKSSYKEVADTRNYLQIRAPFSGVISSRNANPGAYVGPAGKGSELPLFTLQEQKRLRLVISVPEAYTSLLANTTTVAFTVKALPNEKFTAKIKRMAGALDSRLRAERVEMDVFNDNKKLLPGMVSEVSLPLPAQDSTFIIPKSALVNSTEKVFVIRVINNKAEWVDVKKGREADGKVEIYGDLKPEDKLVKVASDEIRNGSELKKVKLAQ
ncbi:MAG: efflux RND transporter periplasmic adaptor subunit [Filimonas sp.]|nr:efflux RND transporter periplasmic adaptor subunit [Filimonas sp.]